MNNSFRSFRRLPRTAQIFLLSEFFFGFASGVISLNLNFHLNARSLDNYMIGMLGMVGSIASAACSLTAGFLSDRMGNHSIVVGGSFIQGLGFFITAFSPNLSGLFLGQILQSMGSACVRTCEFPYITALAETPEQKQNVYFLLIYSFSISNIAGTLTGGFLPKWFQWLSLPGSAGNPYMVPVLLGGLSYGIMGAFRFRLVHDKPKGNTVRRDKGGWLENPYRRRRSGDMVYGVSGVLSYWKRPGRCTDEPCDEKPLWNVRSGNRLPDVNIFYPDSGNSYHASHVDGTFFQRFYCPCDDWNHDLFLWIKRSAFGPCLYSYDDDSCFLCSVLWNGL